MASRSSILLPAVGCRVLLSSSDRSAPRQATDRDGDARGKITRDSGDVSHWNGRAHGARLMGRRRRPCSVENFLNSDSRVTNRAVAPFSPTGDATEERSPFIRKRYGDELDPIAPKAYLGSFAAWTLFVSENGEWHGSPGALRKGRQTSGWMTWQVASEQVHV
jgi:hypothetical protein